ncbi:MAG: hypothetical protein R2856_30120 [Caldilineaceae bacterium]
MIRFTDVVETWEAYETQKSPYYALIPATSQSESALADNESYYWHVRVRHEKYNTKGAYDYGPWSSPMRFKLDSRQAVNPYLSQGDHVSADNVVETTPSFNWDRVEKTRRATRSRSTTTPISAARSSRSCPTAPATSLPLSSRMDRTTGGWRCGVYSKVVGRWSPTMVFTKTSSFPTPIRPISDTVLHDQPTLEWTAVLTPTSEPFLAAPRYRVQLDIDPNFSNRRSYTTDTNAYTI